VTWGSGGDDMSNEKTSYGVIGKLFNSIPPGKKIFALKSQLNDIKKLYDTNSKNVAIRDMYLQLNCQCGDFYFGKKEFDEASKYYEKAYLIAPEEHFLKALASLKLLQISEAWVLGDTLAVDAG
jgi:tetratricopeptide (TPR) repeat protein